MGYSYNYDDDFKYVIQELTHTMIGARYTYAELMASERVPFKFQTIIDRLILPYADAAWTLGEHLLRLTPEDKNYRIYEALKLKVKYFIPRDAQPGGGARGRRREGGGYREVTSPLADFTRAVAASGEPPMVQEIILSNLALMGFKL